MNPKKRTKWCIPVDNNTVYVTWGSSLANDLSEKPALEMCH